MINAIDGHFAELQKAQEKEKVQPQHEDNPLEQPEAAPQEKAAFTPETIYRVRRNPYSDREENAYLLQAYVTQAAASNLDTASTVFRQLLLVPSP